MHLFALIAFLSAANIAPHCPSTYAWPEPRAARSFGELLPTLTLSVTTAFEDHQRLDEQARDPMAALPALESQRALNQANDGRPTAWFLSATWRGLGRQPQSLDETPGPLPQLDACLTLLALETPAEWYLLEPEAAIDRWLEVQVLRTWIAGVSPQGGLQ